MKKKKLWALLTLTMFMLTNILPTIAFAEAQSPPVTQPTPKITLVTAVSTLNTVYAGEKPLIKFQAENAENKSVTITFPTEKDSEDKYYLLTPSVTSQGAGKATAKNNTVTWTPGSPDDELSISAAIHQTALGQYKDLRLSYSVAGGSGDSQEFTMDIKANPINWANASDDSLKNSRLSFESRQFIQDGTQGPQSIPAYVTLELIDKYGNPTSEIANTNGGATTGGATTNSLYIWVEKKGATDVLAQIGTEKNDSTIEASNCKLAKVGGKNVYEISDIKSGTLGFPVNVVSTNNGDYRVYVVQGSSGLTDPNTIRGLTKNGKSAELNLTMFTLTIRDDGNITTDAGRLRDNQRGTITINFDSATVNAAVRLPNGFRTKNDEEKTDENGDKYYLTPIDPKGGSIIVTEVPDQGAKTYQRPSGTADVNYDDFQLYIDGKPYETTTYNCIINVNTAKLPTTVVNRIDFRSGLDPDTQKPLKSFPASVKIAMQNIGNGRGMVYVDFPQEVAPGKPSLIEPAEKNEWIDPVTNEKYWRVEASLLVGVTVVDGAKVINIPLKVPDTGMPNPPYDKKVQIKLATYNTGGTNIYEQGEVGLRLRVTDTMTEIPHKDSLFVKDSLEKLPETTENGETVYREKVTLQLNSPVLNGNNLYVWVVKKGEKDPVAKGRFNINIADPDKNPYAVDNSLVGEGTADGSNNLFAITSTDSEADGDLSTTDADDPITIPLIISSKAFGEEFQVIAALGETAAQALEYVKKGVEDVDYPASGTFDFVSLDKQPTITFSNNGLIYDKKRNGTYGGSVHYEIKNMEKVLEQGRYLVLTLPTYFDIPDTTTTPENPDTQGNDTPQEITIQLGSPKNGVFSGDFKLDELTYMKEMDQTDYEENGIKEILMSDFTGAALRENGKPAYDNVRFEGGITITYRIPDADISMQFSYDQDLKAGPNEPEITKEGKSTITVTMTDKKGGASFLDTRALIFWLEDKDGKPLNTKYLQAPSGYTISTDKVPANERVITFKEINAKHKESENDKEEKDKTPSQRTLTFELNNLSDLDLGQYQICMRVADISTKDDKPDGQILEYKEYTTQGLAFKIVAAEKDKWRFDPVTVDGSPLSDTNVSAEKGFNTKITLRARLVDGTSAALAKQSVKATAEGLGNITAAQDTDDEGYVTYELTTPSNAQNCTVKLSAGEGTAYATDITITIPVVANPSGNDPSGSYDNLDLKIERMTGTVARDDRASIYIRAYDRNDDVVAITSDAAAAKVISEVRFSDLPSASNLTRTNITYRAVDNGIEVYFYPDTTGSYEVTIRGTGNDPTVLRPDITAIRQGKVVRMELDYPETVLGIGKSSSPAILYTYDEDNVRAEKSLYARGIGIAVSGTAMESYNRAGIVKVRNSSRYAGSTIRVVVTDEKLVLQAEYVFEVDEYTSSDGTSSSDEFLSDKSLVLWDNYGGVGLTNRFEFYLTDKSGFRAMLENGQMSSSNGASATVSIVSRPAGSTVRASIERDGRTLEDDGYGYLNLYCNKEGTVRLNITIKVYNPDNSTYYAKRYDYYRDTVDITITDNINASNMVPVKNGTYTPSTSNFANNTTNISVAMFVGSPKYTVNMVQHELDANPYIRDSRTFVPLRALGDALGAAVNFDDATQTISLIYNGERVELQIGSTTVTTTKSGSYRTDVAPEIRDGRTMIPLRTAAEALGCQVEAVNNQYGQTIGALFSK